MAFTAHRSIGRHYPDFTKVIGNFCQDFDAGAEILSSFVMRIRGFFVIFIWLYAKVTWIRAAAHVLVYVYNENFITTLCRNHRPICHYRLHVQQRKSKFKKYSKRP